MSITADNIGFYLSGGSGNIDPNASLGGAISNTPVPINVRNNLFHSVFSNRAITGDTEYRCIYVKNTHPTLTLTNSVLWTPVNSPSTDTIIYVAAGSSKINKTEQEIALDTIEPTSVLFKEAPYKTSGVSLGDLPPNGTKAVWIKRVLSANANQYSLDGIVISTQGETA